MPVRVQPVIETLIEERRRFEVFARSLSVAELERPVPGSSWSVADFIRHVATLDGAYAGWFAALAGESDGRLHRGSAGFDVDQFNDAAVVALRGRAVEAILTEAAGQRASVVRALERLDDALLDTTVRFGGDGKRPPVDLPLAQLLQGWVRHDAIHAADMLKALPGRGDDAAVGEWLGQPATATAISRYQAVMG